MRSRQAAARDSIHGLALGDAFGERWFPLTRSPQEGISRIRARRLPEQEHWRWTDDTAMALGVLETLRTHGVIDPDHLARVFADAYAAAPGRGYGYGMHQLLPELGRDPASWRTRARSLFGGQGSLGNGAAMRTAPLGAWFHDDLEQAALQAPLAAQVTHAHPEGVAGAVAVTVAAALAVRREEAGAAFLRRVADATPASAVRDLLVQGAELPGGTSPSQAADLLGSGQRIRADDTVPFAVWSAAHHLDNLTEALWSTAEGLGDVDTTCAITGGIVAARTALDDVPAAWLSRREPLPDWVDAHGPPGFRH